MPKKPYADTRLAKFIDKRVMELRPRKSQIEIAIDSGFVSVNIGVCQRSCPSISCGVSDFRGAGFGFGVQPYWSGGLPVSGFT